MKKNNLLDFLIILLVSIGISCFPFDLIFSESNLTIVIICQILAQILLLIFKILFTKYKTNLSTKLDKFNFKNLLILLPVYLICFSNFSYLIFNENISSIEFNLLFFLNLILNIFVAINEEFIFRLLFINNLESNSKFLKIFLSSILFALCHLVVVIASRNFDNIIQVGYTFVLGFILGVVLILTNSIVPCIVLHGLFNIFNSVIYSLISPANTNVPFWILCNVIVGIIVLSYIVIILMFIYKRKEKRRN